MTLNPSSKGWIKKYFSIVESHQLQLNRFPGSILNAEELIYAYLQPTGFLYGHPTEFVFLDEEFIKKFTTEEAFKVLLLEGLILVDHLKDGGFDNAYLEQSLERFIDFYEHSNLEKAKKSWLDFSKLDNYDKLESIISQRVEIKQNFTSKLLATYFYNGLLFHDLILYQDYLNGKPEAYITQKRCQVTLDLIKVIAISAYADGEVNDEEKGIFKMFLKSADLDKTHKKIAESFIENPKTLNDIDFDANYYHENGSWLLKRHILEIAILTFWSDKALIASEKEFLDRLTIKLNLKEEDKDNAFISIQSFVLNNKNDAVFLKAKNDVELILSGATKRWIKILGRNKDKLAQELKQSKELVLLIKKSTTSDLSEEEKEKVKTQFYDLAKTVPSLALFMLPGGALILPLVLKIIPNLIPSAFQQNVVGDEEE
jgi:hypothetical protein